MSNDQKLRTVFAELFDVDPAQVTDALGQDQVERWDSMGMVTLASDLEAVFDVEFDLMDFGRFVTVGAVKDVLREHGVAFE